MSLFLSLVGVLAAAFCCFLLVFRVVRKSNVIAFFHPYCNDGGGGERVLWCAVQALLQENESYRIVIYSGDAVSKEEIISKARDRFAISFDSSRVDFVRLRLRFLVEAKYYPVFTLLAQSLAAALVSLEALVKLNPWMFIDTMGCAFTYPVARYLFGCHVACYVHYPTISTDMLGLVARREETYNNRGFISKSAVLTSGKLLYYRLFAWTYGWVGRCSQATMCNSSWTRDHLREIWKINPAVVSPPCNTDALQNIELENREDLVISLGQFRPEKNHMLQVEAMKEVCKRGKRNIRLAILGSCRNGDDEMRVAALRQRIKDLGLESTVELHVNVAWSELKGKWLRNAKAGLHTMWNEHFGINVVEFMASGVIPIAHNSGGPKGDIVVSCEGEATGFLAATAQEYAEAIEQVISESPQGLLALQRRSRRSVNRFSDETFQRSFLQNLPAGLVRKAQ